MTIQGVAMRVLLLSLFLLAGCTPGPSYRTEDCPIYDQLGPIRANPAGAPDRHLQVQAAFRVCPPVEGMAEIRRKHIELKHEILSLLSSKTEEALKDPLRVEKLQKELLLRVNERIMKKGRVVQVMITAFELE